MTADGLTLVDYPSLTSESLAAACEAAIAACDAAVDAIVAHDGPRTFDNTLVALESAVDHVAQADGTYAFMAYVSPDDALRETARQWDERLSKYLVDLGFREDLYHAVRDYAATGHAAALDGVERRLLDRELLDYRRRGFELPKDQRERVQALMNRLVELGVQFRNTIDDWEDGITVTREQLAGLPERFIDNLKRLDEDGEAKYRVSLDYPEFYPFMSNAEDVGLRRELFLKEQRKGGPGNVETLEEAIRIRAEIASLLGYNCWASYILEKRMAKQRDNVASFLEDLEARVRVKFDIDIRELGDLKAARTGDAAINAWDWRYEQNQVLKTTYAVDELEVAKYFPLEASLQGMFDATQELLGVRYERVTGTPVWHEDVEVYDVRDAAGGEPFARFYMDLFPRPNKYGHAAAFTLRSGRLLPDGSYQRPISAIVANLTKPSADSPSLLRHSELVTLWHEFGHILHQTLTRARYLEFSGTHTERDFVEAPSQMLEHWVWERESLRRFARHYETGEPLSDELIDNMVRAKHVASGIATLRQIFFSKLDLTYHSPGFDGDTTRALAGLYPTTGFPYPDGTHFQSGFGHLFGYDAGYYGYLWSRVFGDDMFTRFEAAGIFDRATGAHYRSTVLERGGQVDGDALVRDFLGREPTNDAFLRGLGLEV